MAAEFKIIPLDKIHVPTDRLRKVDEDKALLIGQAIASGTQIGPITVYRTPRGECPYTLAAGATRYRGHQLNGLPEIECVIRKLDKTSARRLEIEENLFRDDLDKLERAEHVAEYRRLWEEEHGEVAANVGGRPKTSVNLTEVSDNAQGHFFSRALDELGLSRSAIERSQFIASNLQPELRDEMRGKPEADNQSLLLKLARLEPQRQKMVARAFVENGDMSQALQLSDPDARAKEKRGQQAEIFDRLMAAWGKADAKTKARFLDEVGAKVASPRERMPQPSEILAEAGVTPPPRPSTNNDLRDDRS